MALTIGQASELFEAQLVGQRDFLIDSVGDPALAKPNTICFAMAESALPKLKASQSKCWVISEKLYDFLEPDVRDQKNFLLTDEPYYLYTKIMNHFHPPVAPKPKVHSQSVIDPTAKVHESAQIEAFVVVGAHSVIGPNVIIHSGVWIDEDVEVGEGSILYSGVKVYHGSRVGKRNILHSGAVIGSDGFGFVQHQGKNVRVPQVGRAILHDEVEVGSNSTIDRGTMGDTIIGARTKIDNLCQVGHNCVLGEDNIMCAFAGASGNTRTGKNVILGAKAGTKGHLSITDNVAVGAQAGVTKNITESGPIKGYPAKPLKEFLKNQALIQRLPEFFKRLTDLEKRFQK